jgi:hypothetical protein
VRLLGLVEPEQSGVAVRVVQPAGTCCNSLGSLLQQAATNCG